MMTHKDTIKERPPVVVVMGHVDHGKSTLLDYIRNTNIVSTEAGGITQSLSAYEVVHPNEAGDDKKITFLDTPGHEAFSAMRERGGAAADIAILVVSAEDGVKKQTLEALSTIVEAKLPYIVAINKIDKPGADIEKTKGELAENGIYIEGYGGNISAVPISAKDGTGVDELLSMILLTAELEGFTGDSSLPATGIVLESHLDPKRGIAATLLIKNGTLKKGDFIVCPGSFTTTRMLEDFMGNLIQEATFSSPIQLTGFSDIPAAGDSFATVSSKKEAEARASENAYRPSEDPVSTINDKKRIPLIIKADTMGSVEALEQELKKLEQETIGLKIISRGVGSISESDIKLASSDEHAIILGFQVKMDSRAIDLNREKNVPVHMFDIIYKLTEWIEEEIETRRPRQEVMELVGSLKVIKVFSKTKERQVVGGRVQEGVFRSSASVRIMRRDNEIGRGTVVGVERNKLKVDEVESGTDCGVLVEARADIASGDVLEAFVLVQK